MNNDITPGLYNGMPTPSYYGQQSPYGLQQGLGLNMPTDSVTSTPYGSPTQEYYNMDPSQEYGYQPTEDDYTNPDQDPIAEMNKMITQDALSTASQSTPSQSSGSSSSDDDDDDDGS